MSTVLLRPRTPKPKTAGAQNLAPIPAEVLEHIVRDGPLTVEEIETASKRFKRRWPLGKDTSS